MTVEYEINRLIKEYQNHLSTCKNIITQAESSDPIIYRKHLEFEKIWKIILNDLVKLSEIVNHEGLNNKIRRS